MKTLYLDIFSGISGDMFLGAMLDLGVDPGRLERELEKLGLHEFHLHISRQERGAIAGIKFDVHVDSAHGHDHHHEHEHDGGTRPHEHHHHAHDHGAHHDHLAGATHGPHGGPLVAAGSTRVELSVFESGVPPRFRLYFYDGHGHEMAPPAAASVTLETRRKGGRRQSFRFNKQGAYLEATALLPEPHEFKAVLKLRQGRRSTSHQVSFVEEHHHHAAGHEHSGGHGHGHSHGHEHGHEHSHGRNFTEIRTLIEQSGLSRWVREKAVAVFHRVAVAEGKIHGRPPEAVHFHEVGAVDSIVDIVGACVALELLDRPRVLAAEPVEGTGMIRCAHGLFPIPAPATLEILGRRGVCLRQCEEPGELITPTGAALLAEFVEEFGSLPPLKVERIGHGLGTRQNQTRPNVLRAILGTTSPGGAAGPDWERDTVAVLETNLDDINAEVLGAFVTQALEAGALDVFHTPVQMKKNRPGVLLTVLCPVEAADRFTEMILRETTAFGVRRTLAERRKLRREQRTVKTRFGPVTVKIGTLNGRVIQSSPEFESCREAAAGAGVPLRAVYQAALKALKP